MNPITKYPNATPETVWAILQETAQLQKENERKFEERRAETDRHMKEAREQMQEAREQMKELREQMKETDRQMKDTDQQMKETDRQMKETDRRMEKLQQTVGAWANSHGSFAADYFFNSFENGKQNFFGEKFDEIRKHVQGIKKNFDDEYDILLINGKTIGIVEVKYKGHKNDIPTILRKATTFRKNFPDFENHRVYLGLATLSFYPELEEACTHNGIAIIKQVGDTVVINDEHLRAY